MLQHTATQTDSPERKLRISVLVTRDTICNTLTLQHCNTDREPRAHAPNPSVGDARYNLATHRNTLELQLTATHSHCYTLQRTLHTATHCNTDREPRARAPNLSVGDARYNLATHRDTLELKLTAKHSHCYTLQHRPRALSERAETQCW